MIRKTKRGLSKGTPPAPAPEPPKKRRRVNLDTPKKVQRLLSRMANDVLADTLPIETARTVTYICQTVLKSLELSLFDDRIRDLERQLSIET
jgi:hypothetical protein